jgi:hypothetical protein
MGDKIMDKDVRTDKDANTEIFFEAHAPKIIIPQEMSSDGGYLLLDTGYLVVKGRMGGAGMSWDISLRYQLSFAIFVFFYSCSSKAESVYFT